jgi:2'-5' RNA ligase
MYYGLAYFPKVEIEGINLIRKKYDPTYGIIDPHLTIMYPVPSSLSEKRIIKHIDTVLKKWRPFKIHFGGFKKSWDFWLFLTLNKGESEVKRLSMEIYSEFLSEYRREDIEFVPHIGMGLFIKNQKHYDFKNPRKLFFDEKKYQKALSEVKTLGLNFSCVIDNLELVEINENFTTIKTIRVFYLE